MKRYNEYGSEFRKTIRVLEGNHPAPTPVTNQTQRDRYRALERDGWARMIDPMTVEITEEGLESLQEAAWASVHADTIRARRKRGQAWRAIYRENNLTGIAGELGMAPCSVRRTLNNHFANPTLTDEDMRQIRRRLRLARHAEYRWRKDSDAALMREYHMSYDTLTRIVDEAPETPSAVTSFLTMRRLP